MGFYDAFKDVLNMAQKADNIDLYRQLLDLSAQALEMQEEIIKLKAENKELKSQKDIEDDIEYYVDPFITRKSDEKSINIVRLVGQTRKSYYHCKTLGKMIIDVLFARLK